MARGQTLGQMFLGFSIGEIKAANSRHGMRGFECSSPKGALMEIRCVEGGVLQARITDIKSEIVPGNTNRTRT